MKVITMKIKMLRSKMGSEDGYNTRYYEEGEEYDVSDALAKSFIGENLAEPATGKPAEKQPEPFVEGQLYTDETGVVFIGAIPDGQAEVALLPIDQLTDDERAELVTEGKLTADGKPLNAKAIESAPKNKAVARAPKNKAKAA